MVLSLYLLRLYTLLPNPDYHVLYYYNLVLELSIGLELMVELIELDREKKEEDSDSHSQIQIQISPIPHYPIQRAHRENQHPEPQTDY